MCLSGVDYFSTLGYQPGIAVAAAGALAPVATLVLVAVTLLGAVPVYRRIAAESPDGLGSVGMLAAMVRGWRGKLLVLVLLGFAACDFMITVTLSASDAAAHLLSSSTSPFLLPVTLVLVGLLAAVFLKGFTEAVRVSVVLVGVYLALTTAVVVAGLWRILTEPGHVADWTAALSSQHSSVWAMAAVAVLVFPKLALGLSGFETGVSVMPLIRPGPGTDPGTE
ncbi:MAG: amino acid transporter, partial [Corynebacterium sp.]|nr:amino acid transporter [Corynebacterium sp.]